jgi:carbamoyltransferase
LVEKLKARIDTLPHPKDNLCFGGGCALSIKWNSKIRDSGIFKNMWVPPFPNDSGSAIGVGCCAMMDKSNVVALDWNICTGPQVVKSSE